MFGQRKRSALQPRGLTLLIVRRRDTAADRWLLEQAGTEGERRALRRVERWDAILRLWAGRR